MRNLLKKATILLFTLFLSFDLMNITNFKVQASEIEPDWSQSMYGDDNPFGAYGKGQCTWYVWGRVKEKLNLHLSVGEWEKQGIVSTTPQTNSISFLKNSQTGVIRHVAFIENYDGVNITYSEANNSYFGEGPYSYYRTTVSRTFYESSTNLGYAGADSIYYVKLEPGFFVSNVTINPSVAIISVFNSFSAKAIISPSSAYNSYTTWRSSSPNVAYVRSDGTVTGWSPGYTYITATSENGVTGRCLVKVVSNEITGITLNTKKATLSIGNGFQIKGSVKPSYAYNKDIMWFSNNPYVASVDSNGNIVANEVGTTEIIGLTVNGISESCVVKVVSLDPKGVSMNLATTTLSIGKSFKARASVYPSNAMNKDVTFSSSNPEVASVDALGNVKTIGAGTAYIKATTVNGKVGQITVNVLPNPESIIISPKSATVKEGATFKATSVVSPSNAVKNVTYSSSTPAVASVDTQGNVKALRKGATYITVTTHNGKMAKFLLRVV